MSAFVFFGLGLEEKLKKTMYVSDKEAKMKSLGR